MKRPIDAVIESVVSEPSKIQPIIVNFQNGELKDEEAKKMSCGVFYDQKKQKTVLALSNGQVVYKGYKPDAKNELTRTMLVLHNKRTGKVRLIEAERWQVSPVLDKPTVDNVKNSADDKIAQLNKQFGSKKVKRRTEQFERMKINVESVKEQLEQTVSNVEIDRVDLSLPVSNDEYITNTNLPQINRDATSAKDVYNIDDIVPKTKLESLYETAMKVINDEVEGGKSKFFTRTLQYLKSDPENVKKVALLLYIESTAAWLNMPIKDAKKRGITVCPYSQEINTYIIDNYSINSAHGRSRPNSMRDKGVIHCMILALMIFNFVLDIEMFSTILNNRIGLKKLTDLARIIAATPNKEDKKIIALKVPLPTQMAVVKKGKKK